MSFASSHNPPQLTRGEMKSFNQQFGDAATALRYTYVRCLERVLIRHLTPSEYMVISAICSRTLGWKKLVEIISLAPFSDGMRTVDNKPVMYNEKPVFLGTSLSRRTVINSLQGLERKGMIARFAVDSYGRTTHAIMPFSVAVLSYIVENRPQYGEIPEYIRRGEKTELLEDSYHRNIEFVLAHYLVDGAFTDLFADWFDSINELSE